MSLLVNNAQKGQNLSKIKFHIEFESQMDEMIYDENELFLTKLKELETQNKNGLVDFTPELYSLLLFGNNALQFIEGSVYWAENSWATMTAVNQAKKFAYEARLITGNLTSGKKDVNILENLLGYSQFCFSKDVQKLNKAKKLAEKVDDKKSEKKYKSQLRALRNHAIQVGLEKELNGMESLVASEVELPSLQELLYGTQEFEELMVEYLSLEEFEKEWMLEEYPLIHTVTSFAGYREVTFSNEKFINTLDRFEDYHKWYSPYIATINEQLGFMFRAFNLWHFSLTGKTVIRT